MPSRNAAPRLFRGQAAPSGPIAPLLAVALLTVVLFAGPATGQQPITNGQGVGANGSWISVFLDCASRNCNQNYFRTELPWVNWVRLPEDSDVHVIMTSQSTGAGGREYQLDYIGVGDFEYERQLTYQAPPTNTDRETLDELAHAIGVGLLHFATVNGFFEEIAEFREISDVLARNGETVDPAERVVTQEEVEDPWNFWVFRLGGRTELQGEQTRRTQRIDGNFSASRVTPTWKMNFRGNANYNRREIDLVDAPTFIDSRTDWGFSHLIAYSLADHWSIGVQGEMRRIVRFNQAFRAEMTPALEYSFFPYEEATRRALTVFYKIGPAYRNYLEETAFGQTEETRWEQSLEFELSQRQQWGDASISMTGSHFLHDIDLYNVRLGGDIDFRIARGLSLNAEGNISWVNDQIYLSAEGATDAEALLNLQQRAQDFNYSLQLGFSFQFGSIYNNVVNNRFSGGGGGWWWWR